MTTELTAIRKKLEKKLKEERYILSLIHISPFVLKGKNLLSSLDSTVRKKTEPLSLFPAAVLISQALWLPVQLWLTCMKTGPMYPDF